MKIVFLGTPDIAAACLQKIVEDGFDVAAVYTKPDMPKNRGMKLAMSDVKQYALTQDIPVLQPQSFRDPAVVEELRALAPEETESFLEKVYDGSVGMLVSNLVGRGVLSDAEIRELRAILDAAEGKETPPC